MLFPKEPSGLCFNLFKTFMILNSFQVLSPSVCLRFAYHMYGRSIKQLEVKIQTESGGVKVVWKRSGDQGDIWETANVTIHNSNAYKVSVNVTCEFTCFQLFFSTAFEPHKKNITHLGGRVAIKMIGLDIERMVISERLIPLKKYHFDK